MADEELRVVLKAVESGNVAELKAKVQALEASLKSLTPAMAQNSTQAREWAQELANANKQLSAMGGSFKAGGLNNLFSQLGFAADDLQYGFKGIANNIQPILMSIPGLGAIAGILSAATIAAYNFLPPLHKIGEGLGLVAEKGGLAGTSIADLTDRLKTLEEKSPKFEADFIAIDEYKKKLEGLKANVEAFDAARKKPTAAQKVGASNAEELLRGGETGDKSGAENLQELVKKGLEKQGLKGAGGLLTERGELEKAKKFYEEQINLGGDENGNFRGMLDAIKPQLDKINHEIGASSDEQAKLIVGGYVRGTEEGRKKLRELAEKDPEAFKKAFGKDFTTDLGKSGAQLKDEGSIEDQRKADLDEIAKKEKEFYAFEKEQEKEKIDAMEAEKKDFAKVVADQQHDAREIGSDIVAGKGEVGNKAILGTLTEEDVAKFLKGIGSSADALMVLTAAQEEAARVVTKTASHEGVDRETAAKQIVEERNQKEADAAERKEKQQGARGVKAAKEALPGIEDVIKTGLKAGMSDKQIFQSLRGQFGDAAAAKLVQEGRGKVSEGNLDEFLNPKDTQVRSSEIVGAADFANSIQGGVSNEMAKKAEEQINKLGAIHQVLAEIKNNGGVIFKK